MALGTILSKCCSNLMRCKCLFGVKLLVIYISPCQYEMGNINCVHANHLENITCSFIEVAHLHLVLHRVCVRCKVLGSISTLDGYYLLHSIH